MSAAESASAACSSRSRGARDPSSGRSEGGASSRWGSRRPVRSTFARISESILDVPSPRPLFELALKKAKPEFYRHVRIRGDGRCMFRALAVGLAHIKRQNLTSAEEERDADQLRLAVAESMCRSPEKRKSFEAAAVAVSFEMPIETYCKRILAPTFWGGEPELLVLAQILRRPIVVYIPAAKAKSTQSNSGYVPIQTYGAEHAANKKGKPRAPVRLLYNGENHYDLLI